MESNKSNIQESTVNVVIRDESVKFAVVTLIFYLLLYPIGFIFNIVGLIKGPRRGCFVAMFFTFVLLVPLLALVLLNVTHTLQDMFQKFDIMQNIHMSSEHLYRELTQAIINTNRPDCEQVYFEIKQLSAEQSVLRFGCMTKSGPMEVAYQIKPANNPDGTPQWCDYELWRLSKTNNMWNCHEDEWPNINFDMPEAEPFACNIISFKVQYWSTKRNSWEAENWDSFQRNSMPRKIRVDISTLPKRAAKKLHGVTDLNQIEERETFEFEITLPQSQ